MRTILLSLVVLMIAVFESYASEPLTSVNTRGKYKNQVNLGLSFMIEYGRSQALVPAAYVAYARNIKGKFYLGGSLGTRYAMFEGDRDGGCVIPVNIIWMTTAYCNAFWELPVIPRWLSFRCGGGIGLGYHSVEGDELDKSVAPYFNATMEWVIHCSRSIDIALSPLIIGPSRFEYSPAARLGRDYREQTFMLDCLHLSVGVRF